MHIAFVVQPAFGHVLPTLTLVTELIHRGHRVSYATGPTMVDRVANAGAQPVELPSELPSRPPSRATFLSHGWAELTSHHLVDARRSFPPLLAHFQADPPDAVCYDNWTYTGRMLAQVLGVPEIALVTSFAASEAFNLSDELHGPGFGNDDPVLQDLYRQRAAFAAEYGVHSSLDGLDGTGSAPLNLVLQPREFQFEPDAFDDRYRFIGPMLGRDEDTTWAAGTASEPIVYISLGTAFNTDASFYRTAFEAVADSPWHVVVASGARIDPLDLGAVPSNVELHTAVPQLEVLQRARAHVSHGGMNSMMESLSFGVPVIAVPQMPEQDGVARRGEALRAARRLDPDDVSADALRDAIADVLDNPEIQVGTEAMRRVIRNCGGALAGADSIEAFASKPAVRTQSASSPEITVVIPTYNRADLLKRTLESLTQQSVPTEDFEVVVSDDGSSDHTTEVVDGFRGRLRIRGTFQEDRGYRAALARNNGARLASSGLLAFLDSGMLAGPDWLLEHVTAHREKAGRHAVLGYAYGFHPQSPLSMDEVLDSTASELVAAHGREAGFQDARLADFELVGFDLERLEAPWHFFWTNNVSVRSEDFWRAGGFDESFRGWGVEDLDLGFRLSRQGVRMTASREAWAVESPHERDWETNFSSCRANALQFHLKYSVPMSELYWAYLQHRPREAYDAAWIHIRDAIAEAPSDVETELGEVRTTGRRVAVLGCGAAIPRAWHDRYDEIALVDLDPDLLDKVVPVTRFGGAKLTTEVAIGLRTSYVDGAFDDVVVSPRLRPIWKRWGHSVLDEAGRIGGIVHQSFDEDPDPLPEE